MPDTPQSPNEQPGASPRVLKFLLGYVIVAGIVIVGLVAMILTQQPDPPATPELVATPKLEKTPTSSESAFILFVPNDNAMLEKETVTDTSTRADAPYPQKAKRALELLFPRLDFLPQGTRLLAAPVKESRDVVRLNFSKEFQKLNGQHETPIMLTLDAMARTLGALESENSQDLEPVKVRVLVEGKSIPTLGEFTLSEPWKASETVPPETLNPEDVT